MNGDEQTSLDVIGFKVDTVVKKVDSIEAKLDKFTEAAVIRRLDDVEERLRWYGRWLLGIIGMVVASGVAIYVAAR